MLNDKRGSKWAALKEELQRGKVKVLRLKRVNRLEQALSVYFKKRPVEFGQNGKLVRTPARRPADGPRPVADLGELDSILATITARERSLDAVADYLALPTLTLTYEELVRDHRPTLRKLGTFLSVKLDPDAAPGPSVARWVKQGPSGVCDTVKDYGAFCARYSKSAYAEHLPDPCLPGVWDCCKCKPTPRLVFPGASAR